jgi:hypothetical protein
VSGNAILSSHQPRNCLVGYVVVVQISPHSSGVNNFSLKSVLTLLASLIMSRAFDFIYAGGTQGFIVQKHKKSPWRSCFSVV